MKNLFGCVYALVLMAGAFCFAWMLSVMELDLVLRLLLLTMTLGCVLGSVVVLFTLTNTQKS